MEEAKIIKKKRLHTVWSQKEAEIVESASKDRLNVDEIYLEIKELLPEKEEHSIRSKIYSATKVLRNRKRLNSEIALKEKRELKEAAKNGISNPLSTASLISKAEAVECAEVIGVDESKAAIEAVKERIKSAQEPLFCTKIIPESITEELVEEIEEDLSVLKYENKTILVSKGTIKVPFVGEIECDFEITGTFSIRKVGKKTLL